VSVEREVQAQVFVAALDNITVDYGRDELQIAFAIGIRSSSVSRIRISESSIRIGPFLPGAKGQAGEAFSCLQCSNED
jgi:hypothetical protein